jgi:hypothetical protein
VKHRHIDARAQAIERRKRRREEFGEVDNIVEVCNTPVERMFRRTAVEAEPILVRAGSDVR